MDWRTRNKDMTFCSTYNGPSDKLSISLAPLTTPSKEILQPPLCRGGNWVPEKWSYLPKVSDPTPESLTLFHHKCPEKEANRGHQDQAAWGSLCSFLLNVPGLCRGALILIFKTISVNDNNLALTLIYQSMILAVVITKLNQTTRQNQNSEGWHFNIKQSTTLRNRNHKNRTAESPQGQVFLEPGDRRKFQHLKGQQIAKSDYLWR